MTDLENSNAFVAFLDRMRQMSHLGVLVFASFATFIVFNATDGLFLEHIITWRNQYLPDTTPMRIGFVLVSGLIGFCIGWFLSGKHKNLRAIFMGFVAGLLCFLVIADHGVLGWGSSSFMSVCAFIVALGYWVKSKGSQLVQNFKNKIAERPTTLGSSEWANHEHCIDGDVVDGSGIQLGTFPAPDGTQAKLTYNGDRHILTTSPNRSGKGTTAIIPNLLTYLGSVLVADPKGENAMITAKHRKELLGQTVHVVDGWGITGLKGSRINPMDWLVKGDIDIAENALLLADAIIMTAGGDEQFWNDEAKALLLGVILLVALDDEYEGRRDLGTVRDQLCLDGKHLDALFKLMLQSHHPVVRSTGARCLQKEEKLLSNVLASVQAQTHFLDSQRVRDVLAVSDFSFADLKANPTSIYIVIPSDKLDIYARLLRLLIQQALSINARDIEKQPEKPVLFILDEMPALGKLSKVETAFGLMAGYGMQLWGICQDASQLKRIYGDGWETFVSNAGVLQYFGSRDKMTAEYFSSLCGVTTVWNWSTALARAFGITRGKDISSSDTTTHTDTASGMQRKLAFPDELMRMPKDKQLLLIDNLNPIIATKQPWFENPDLKDLGVNLHDKD